MQATEILKTAKEAKSVDEYLGYTIQEVSGWYLAVPNGWTGDVLEASSMPQMRRKIWRWWHHVELTA